MPDPVIRFPCFLPSDEDPDQAQRPHLLTIDGHT
jgi:hypothetical protein